MRPNIKEDIVHQCLINNYEKYYKIALGHVGNDQDAQDIVQEAAYKAVLKSGQLREVQFADTWICRIVINESYRFLKKHSGKTIPLDEMHEEGVEDNPENIDLKRALNALSPEDRTLIILRYFEDNKIETVGKILNVNTSTVKSRIYRATQKLEKLLSNGG